MDYGEKFKLHRRYLQQYFGKQNLSKYYDIEVKEVYKLLNDILDSPDDYAAHIKRYVGLRRN